MAEGRRTGFLKRRMRFGLHLPQLGRSASCDHLVSVARRAEELGFDDVWTADHVAVPLSLEGMPSFFPEPVPLLAAAAAHTRKVGLGTSVLVPAYRNPMQFAKQWATLDWLSGGRTILGVGAGWLEEEFAACGVPMARRGQRLDDYIAGWRAAWSGAVEFESTHFSFEGVRIKPTPPGPVPIWVGGSSEGALRRAARSEGWMGTWAPLKVFRERLEELRSYQQEQGRQDRQGRQEQRQSRGDPHHEPAGKPQPQPQDEPDDHPAAWEPTISIHMEVRLGDSLSNGGRWSEVGDGYGDREMVSGSPAAIAETLDGYIQAGLQHVLMVPLARSTEEWDAHIEGLCEVKSMLSSSCA